MMCVGHIKSDEVLKKTMTSPKEEEILLADYFWTQLVSLPWVHTHTHHTLLENPDYDTEHTLKLAIKT